MQKTSPIYQTIAPRVCFKSTHTEGDSFERQSAKTKGYEIVSPMDNRTYKTDEVIDLTKPHRFEWSTQKPDSYFRSKLSVDFDPKRTGTLIDKKTKKPFEVFILKSHDTKDEEKDNFHFVSKDLKKEYGRVCFTTDYESCSEKIYSDYPKEGIKGDRLVVLWLENKYENEVGGIGKLADKIAVQYCKENHIKPNIISTAYKDSMLAHYKRGKRFIEPEKGSTMHKFLVETFGKSNPNEIFEDMLKEAEKTGKKIDLTPFIEQESLVMYLPKNLVKRYK